MKLRKPEQLAILPEFFRWLIIASLIGVLAGCASGIFYRGLNWVSDYRESHVWIIALLPLSGFAVGLIYHLFGQQVERGNNLILDEIHDPKMIIPVRMAFLVLLGTLLTHLFGGSAGREGTAIQMSGSLADQLTRIFRLTPERRRILLMAGMAAGFGSIFGTPLAGAVFGLEVLSIGRMRYDAILPCFVASIIGNEVTHLIGVHHPHFSVGEIPQFTVIVLLAAVFAGALFGLTGAAFAAITHRITHFFKEKFAYPPLRPLLGGLVVAAAVGLLHSTRYIGLGVPQIIESFQGPVPIWDFAAKTLFTAVTLGAGFKGGEVTPLFFIGATLGNALSHFLPLPLPLLAGMGYVGVFAGAANAPLTCTLVGMEMFGVESGVLIALACVSSYLFSGHAGIYSSQKVETRKFL